MARQKFNRSWGDIAFDDDIILNVAEKTGFTAKQVQIIFNFIFGFIKQDIKNPDRHLLYLPFLGTLYFKVEQARNRLNDYKKLEEKGRIFSRAAKERIKRTTRQVEIFDDFYAMHTKEKKKFSVHKTRRIISNYYYTKMGTPEEVEEAQNGFYDKN